MPCCRNIWQNTITRSRNYPHTFSRSLAIGQANLSSAETIVRGWLDTVNATSAHTAIVGPSQNWLAMRRVGCLFGHLRQPVAGLGRARDGALRGAADLAETDELIGAETYVLAKVRDLATARNFCTMIERFKERVGLARCLGRGQPLGRQQIPRLVQHHPQIDRRSA